jgi:hypothetical protein
MGRASEVSSGFGGVAIDRVTANSPVGTVVEGRGIVGP